MIPIADYHITTYHDVENCYLHHHFDGLVQERRNSSALAMKLRLSCTKPSIYRKWIRSIYHN